MSVDNGTRDWLVKHNEWPVAIPVSKVGSAVDDLIELLNPKWVKDKVAKYRKWQSRHSMDIPDLLFHREPDCNPLIPYFAVYDEWVSSGSPLNWTGSKVKAISDLAQIAGNIYQFESYWKSTPNGRGEHHLRRNLQMWRHCRGLLAEMLIATNFVQRGATNVVPRFMIPAESSDKSDILLTWEGQDLEVHCKSKVPGAGYLIPFDVFDYLAGCFLRYAEESGLSWHIQLQVTETPTIKKAKALRYRLLNWLKPGLIFNSMPIDEWTTVTSKPIELPSEGINLSKIYDLSLMRHYRAYSATKADQRGNYHTLSVFDAINIRPPKPLHALSASIKEAKHQVTGLRPAIVSIHMFDSLNLEELNTQPLATAITKWVFNQLADSLGQKISALVLTSEPQWQPWVGIVGTRDYPAIWWRNPNANIPLPENIIHASSALHDAANNT